MSFIIEVVPKLLEYDELSIWVYFTYRKVFILIQIPHQLPDLFSPDSDVVCDKGMSEPCLWKVPKQVILVITCCLILGRNVRDQLGEGSFLHLDCKQFLPFLFAEVGHSSWLGISNYWRPQVFSACAGVSDLGLSPQVFRPENSVLLVLSRSLCCSSHQVWDPCL